MNDTRRKSNTRTSTNGGTESGLLENEGSGLLGNDTVYANDGDENENTERENRGENTDDDETRL